MFSSHEINSYEEKGYLLVPGLFSEEEVNALRDAAEENERLRSATFSRDDGEGGSVDLALWNKVDDSIFGLFPRSERLVNRMEQLLGGEVYHYHSKLIQKNPGTGGAWTWHQDYGGARAAHRAEFWQCDDRGGQGHTGEWMPAGN